MISLFSSDFVFDSIQSTYLINYGHCLRKIKCVIIKNVILLFMYF